MINNDLLVKNIVILDEALYTKKVKGLKRYFLKSYKALIFEVIPELTRSGKKDGVYSVVIPTDSVFEAVYGKLELYFSVKNDVVIIEDIVPSDILIQCHMKSLPIYKGMPYYRKQDLFKIKVMEKKNEKEIKSDNKKNKKEFIER